MNPQALRHMPLKHARMPVPPLPQNHIKILAAPLGFEPRQAAPEAAVLPLHNRAIPFSAERGGVLKTPGAFFLPQEGHGVKKTRADRTPCDRDTAGMDELFTA